MRSLQINNNLPNILKNKRNAHIGHRSFENCDAFRHIAVVMKASGHILSVGYNHHQCVSLSSRLQGRSIHAEHDALNKAYDKYARISRKHRTNKKKQKVEMMVIRANGQNSRPCYDCIMRHICDNKFFNIRKIYYSSSSTGDPFELETTTKGRLYDSRFYHVSKASRIYSSYEQLSDDLKCQLTSGNSKHDGHDLEDKEDEDCKMDDDSIEGKQRS